MVFDLSRRPDTAARNFDLAVRSILAQWEIDAAASQHRRRMLQLARAKQLEYTFSNLRLDWRRPFESDNRRQ